MANVICGISTTLDGYVAGLNMTEQEPFGDMPDGLLHRWMFDEPERHEAELRALGSTAGAYIMGRNMFGPAGPAYDQTWTGWWGDDPPFHAPVFVLTHRARAPIPMQGGTTFHFVTGGIDAALAQARAAAGDEPVAIAGGASVVNQYLAVGAIDELWLHIAPLTFGHGKRLFEQIPDLRLEPISVGGTELVTHIRYRVVR